MSKTRTDLPAPRTPAPDTPPPLRERLRQLFARYGFEPGGKLSPSDPDWQLRTMSQLCPQIGSEEHRKTFGVTLQRLYNPDQALLLRIERPVLLVYDPAGVAILHQYDGDMCQWLETRGRLVALHAAATSRIVACTRAAIDAGLDQQSVARLAATVAGVPIPSTPSRLLLDHDARDAIFEALVPVFTYYGRGAVIWQNQA